jgi:hypothetical protein
MQLRHTRLATLGAALLSLSVFSALSATVAFCGTARDTASPEPSALALPASTLELPLATVVTDAPLEVAVLHTIGVPEVQMAGVHYRPRRSGLARGADAASVSQIHLGFFDPDGDPSRRFLMGIRGGPMVDSRVQLGVGVDWAHQNDNVSSVSSTTIGPGGTPITVKRDLARASSNLFPIMGFVQVSAPDNMSVVPYFGAGAGYELMNLSADDFQTGESFDATYGGWGWQVWGGVALPLSGRTRLTGEIFVNGAELGRDVDDSLTGLTYRETVKADGMGARFGLAWGF